MFDQVLSSGDPEALPRLLASTGITFVLGSALLFGGIGVGAIPPLVAKATPAAHTAVSWPAPNAGVYDVRVRMR